jgi:simple sugar transport system substrate-binding protein
VLKKLFALVVTGAALLAVSVLAVGAASKTSVKTGATGNITLGFSQVGSESGWRAANTKSIQSSAKAAGITLKFSDAQQKQQNQIQAIRSYIQQRVDVIAFSPVVESGWDAVLNEAKRAKIPVILTDRAVDSKDPTLYKTFLGSDFVKEGREVGQWVLNNYKNATGTVNIVELEGTTGSAPAIDRKKGFTDVIKANPKLKVIASQTGEFTRAKGKEVMTAFLKAHSHIDLLFAHNDDMGLGAIEAIQAAGSSPASTSRSSRSMQCTTVWRHSPPARSTSSQSAARCSGRS